ncbi:FadR/GntR family transcriptional regulator [Bacillus sp. Marseille-P3661]|uniref:FadR/GntR family transcriptional regulator n=1 Tax=Bacillus sp. Marseille-P3661 TaxID=1936234 RepID=UPI0021557779|nr:FadR/GntR family transcriptional regulator [Bacillus sp. Marseille-P3661]
MDGKLAQVKMKSVKRKTLSNQVIDQIIDLLMSGQLNPGDKLPSEMELMEMLFVSRPVLREALSSLETIGLIHRKTRDGTYFSDKIGSNPYRIMLALSAGNIESILESRLSQELGLVTLAAEKISEFDLKRLQETIEKMEIAESDYSAVDREFHRIIAHSASNSITEGIIDPLLNMYDKTLENIALENRNKSITIQQHKDIYIALEKRDPIKSFTSMYRHLDYVRNKVLASISNLNKI